MQEDMRERALALVPELESKWPQTNQTMLKANRDFYGAISWLKINPDAEAKAKLLNAIDKAYFLIMVPSKHNIWQGEEELSLEQIKRSVIYMSSTFPYPAIRPVIVGKGEQIYPLVALAKNVHMARDEYEPFSLRRVNLTQIVDAINRFIQKYKIGNMDGIALDCFDEDQAVLLDLETLNIWRSFKERQSIPGGNFIIISGLQTDLHDKFIVPGEQEAALRAVCCLGVINTPEITRIKAGVSVSPKQDAERELVVTVDFKDGVADNDRFDILHNFQQYVLNNNPDYQARYLAILDGESKHFLKNWNNAATWLEQDLSKSNPDLHLRNYKASLNSQNVVSNAVDKLNFGIPPFTIKDQVDDDLALF